MEQINTAGLHENMYVRVVGPVMLGWYLVGFAVDSLLKKALILGPATRIYSIVTHLRLVEMVEQSCSRVGEGTYFQIIILEGVLVSH